MISFDTAHGAVHYPEDRRFWIWVRPSILTGVAIVVLSAGLASWVELFIAGLPNVPPVPPSLSQQLRWAAWLSALDALLSFLQFSVRDDADSQRSVDPDGSSTPLFQ